MRAEESWDTDGRLLGRDLALESKALATSEDTLREKRHRGKRAALGRRVANRLWTAFILFYTKVTYWMPISLARFSGRVLARLAYWVLPRRRRIGMSNLDLAYGDSLTRAEKTRILRASFENFGIVAAEFSRIPDVNTERGRHYVRTENIECIDRSQAALIVGAHMANWEWMGPCMARAGFNLSMVVNRYDDAARGGLIDAIRRSGGVETISKHRAAPKILRALRKGRVVGLIVDQSAREGARQVEVFGHACWASAVPAHLALRTGVPIYFGTMRREKDGTYTATFSGPAKYEQSGDLATDVTAFTQVLQSGIESLIRETPEQWMWTHDRWKRRPELEQAAEAQQAKTDAQTSAAAKAGKTASAD